jgi:hypothetical protein
MPQAERAALRVARLRAFDPAEQGRKFFSQNSAGRLAPGRRLPCRLWLLSHPPPSAGRKPKTIPVTSLRRFARRRRATVLPCGVNAGQHSARRRQRTSLCRRQSGQPSAWRGCGLPALLSKAESFLAKTPPVASLPADGCHVASGSCRILRRLRAENRKQFLLPPCVGCPPPRGDCSSRSNEQLSSLKHHLQRRLVDSG